MYKSRKATIGGEDLGINEILTSDSSKNQSLTPLDGRIVEVIKKNRCAHTQSYLVRPAQVASELAISIDDANAELCGLMRAVGPSATFQFESLPINSSTSSPQSTVMVFHFPINFERKAYLTKRKESLKDGMWNFLFALWKVVKVVVAFGLVISVLFVMIYTIILMIALIVGFARAGGSGGGSRMNQHHQINRIYFAIRSMQYMFRQFFWIYMIIRGFDQAETVDPFFADIAYTLAFICNPYSYWMWFRMINRRNRRNRATRGWRNNPSNNNGISFKRQSTWSSNDGNSEEEDDRSSINAATNTDSTSIALTNENLPSLHQQQSDERGILSNTVEFLFGPTPFHPGPSEFRKWKLRENFILSCIAKSTNQGISLVELLPLVNHPPSDKLCEDELWNNMSMRSECLNIVTHFNGVPYDDQDDTKSINRGSEQSKSFRAKFVFPELVSLHAENFIGENINSSTVNRREQSESEDDDDSTYSFLYRNDQKSNDSSFGGRGHVLGGNSPRRRLRSSPNSQTSISIQDYLIEKKYSFTKLKKSDFNMCIRMNIINYFALRIFMKLLEKGEFNGPWQQFIQRMLQSMMNSLLIYSKFFFILPLCRMLMLVVLNFEIKRRNERRKNFAETYKT